VGTRKKKRKVGEEKGKKKKEEEGVSFSTQILERLSTLLSPIRT